MPNLAETINVNSELVSNYTIENAGRDAKALHKLNKQLVQATTMIDAEIADLQKDLQALEERKREIAEPTLAEMERLKNNLMAFHRQEVERGGERTLKLPWATLKAKKQPQGYVKDEGILLDWVQANADEYVKQAAPVVNWGELKKQLVVMNDKVFFRKTGDLVEGLTPDEVKVKFEVEVL